MSYILLKILLQEICDGDYVYFVKLYCSYTDRLRLLTEKLKTKIERQIYTDRYRNKGKQFFFLK